MPTPDDAGKPVRQPKAKSPAMDCTGCKHFHEETVSADELRWGECWRYPPAMLLQVKDDGSTVAEPAVASVCLPYVCGEFQPRLQ